MRILASITLIFFGLFVPCSFGQNLHPIDYLSQTLTDDVEVIMLGEPSHREGSIMELNGDIAIELFSNNDFTVFAIESSFYDVLKASSLSDDSAKYYHALREAIYPVWSQSLEFQPLLNYLVQNRKKITVVGFDFQIGFLANEYLLIDIEHLFKGSYSREDYDLLDDLISSLYYSELPASYNRDSVHLLLRGMIEDVSEMPLSKDSVANWQIILNQIIDLEIWYSQNGIANKTQETFEAKDSNPRDLAMAETLLKWRENNDSPKTIAWGASLHFASNLRSLGNSELDQFESMGQVLKNRLTTRVKTLGSFFGTGTYGYNFNMPDSLTRSSLGTLERSLIDDNLENGLINWEELHKTQSNFSSVAFDFKELEGDWEEVFDYHLFNRRLKSASRLNSVGPPINMDDLFLKDEAAGTDIEEANDSTTSLEEKDESIRNKNLIRKRLQSGFVVTGRIIDSSTQLPIPFAHIYTSTFGTYSNPKGEFKLNVSEKDSLHISCIGYGMKKVGFLEDWKEISLEPKVEYLSEINVVGERETPESIFAKALDAIKDNYLMDSISGSYSVVAKGLLNEEPNYSVGYKIHSNKLTGYSTIRKSKFGGVETNREVYDVNWELYPSSIQYMSSFINDNYPRAMYDYQDLGKHPLFDAKNIRRYLFEIAEYNAKDSLITLSIEAKKLNFQTTNRFYLEGFKGSVVIDERDYSIVETEFHWYLDIEKLSRFSEKYVDKKKETFFTKYTNRNVFEKSVYSKLEDGKYYLTKNEFRRHISGIDLRSNEEYDLKEEAVSTLIEMEKEFQSIESQDLYIPRN